MFNENLSCDLLVWPHRCGTLKRPSQGSSRIWAVPSQFAMSTSKPRSFLARSSGAILVPCPCMDESAIYADRVSSYILGKDEVTGSNPVISSRNQSEMAGFLWFWGGFRRNARSALHLSDPLASKSGFCPKPCPKFACAAPEKPCAAGDFRLWRVSRILSSQANP